MHFDHDMTYNDVLLAGELRVKNGFNYQQYDKNATEAKNHFEHFVYDSITRELMGISIGSPAQVIQLVEKHHKGRFQQIFGNTLDINNVTDFSDLFNINPDPSTNTETTNKEHADENITTTTTNSTTNEQNAITGLNDTTNNNEIHLHQQNVQQDNNTTTIQESATNDDEISEFHDTQQDPQSISNNDNDNKEN